METFHAFVMGCYQLLTTWYVAGILGGILILVAERRDARKRRVRSDDDVREVADRYRQHYGPDAEWVIADHIFAARLGGHLPYRDFLRRVAERIRAHAVTDADRVEAIEGHRD